MPRLTRETRIAASPDAVFACLADPKERAQWLTSMKESPVEGALRVGSRIAARRTAPGSKSTYELTVTRLDAPRQIAMDIRRNGAPAGTGGYDLAPDGGGTLVRAFAEYELSGLQKMMGPIVSAGLQNELDADLRGLKRYAEGKR
jgi:carbon monoxide dehydrogenase subunit G